MDGNRFPAGCWSFLRPGSEKNCHSTWQQTTRRMGQSRWNDDGQIRRKRTPSLPSNESVVSRNAQKKRRWKIINTSSLMEERLKLFRSIIPGAVSNLCEECKTCHVRTARIVLAGQSDPWFVPTSSLMKTPTTSTDDPAKDLLHKYQERVERLSQKNRVIKICTDAQYFMTKLTDEFSQFTESAACREYTLPRDEKISDPNGWIRANTKIWIVLEVTTCCLQGQLWSGN